MHTCIQSPGYTPRIYTILSSQLYVNKDFHREKNKGIKFVKIPWDKKELPMSLGTYMGISGPWIEAQNGV